MSRLFALALALPIVAFGASGPAPKRPVPAAHAAAATTTFTVRIQNVSTPATLKLSNGESAPAPTGPALYVVNTGADPLFTEGSPDRAKGLEHLAEDGNPGDLAKALGGMAGIAQVGTVSRPQGDILPGPITPGKAYEFSLDASPGQRLSVAFMFGQSNDLFYAPGGRSIELFPGGKALSGDITSQLVLWDAGTEVNQEPGLGSDQGPRQKGANTGAAEHAPVRRIEQVHDGFDYPATAQVIRVTVTPSGPAVSKR